MGPVRTGSGEISCSMVTARGESGSLEHPVKVHVVAKDSNRGFSHRFVVKLLALKACVPIRRCRPFSPAPSRVETRGSTSR